MIAYQKSNSEIVATKLTFVFSRFLFRLRKQFVAQSMIGFTWVCVSLEQFQQRATKEVQLTVWCVESLLFILSLSINQRIANFVCIVRKTRKVSSSFPFTPLSILYKHVQIVYKIVFQIDQANFFLETFFFQHSFD